MLADAKGQIEAVSAGEKVWAHSCDVSRADQIAAMYPLLEAEFGAIRLARLAVPGMKQRRWGRIVNILNIGARAPRPEGAPTQVSRAAGLALTKILAGECAPHNVLVNALLTGTIVTDQVRRRHERPGLGAPCLGRRAWRR